MVKKKDNQHNGQKEGQTTQWSKRRTNNTMVKRKKDKQHNGQKEEQTTQTSGYPFGIFKLF
jgi:hypothetical protein